jgi:hypothetical protein
MHVHQATFFPMWLAILFMLKFVGPMGEAQRLHVEYDGPEVDHAV